MSSDPQQSEALKRALEEMRIERENYHQKILHERGSISATAGEDATPVNSPQVSPVAHNDSPIAYVAIPEVLPPDPVATPLTLRACLRYWCCCYR